MDPISLCYTGCCFDYSGYGEANRNFIKALHTAGVRLQVQAPSYVVDVADFGELGKLCRELSTCEVDNRIKVLHVTPDQYPRFMEPGKYHIGHLFWETTRLPKDFADACQLMDEIWTGSHTNAQAIRDSGFAKPIFVCPQAIDTAMERSKPYVIPHFDGFLFYSVFEWTERKNPKALIRAFYEEFSKEEKVGLLVKTYFDSFNEKQSGYVMGEMRRLKRQYGLDRAPVMVYRHLMDRKHVMRLHSTGDCFVTAHRGEGWGIPIVEAMLHGNPVITTGYNGVNEYLDKKTAYLLTPTMVPVTGMERNDVWYTADQQWADIDIAELRRTLRTVFQDQEKARKTGQAGKRFVEKRFNYEAVGKLLKGRLEEISKGL